MSEKVKAPAYRVAICDCKAPICEPPNRWNKHYIMFCKICKGVLTTKHIGYVLFIDNYGR